MRRDAQVLALTIIALASLASASAAPDHVIANSADWRDVYSTVLYANILGVPNNFLTSSRHSTLLLYSIPLTKQYLQVISSKRNPFIVGYEDVLKNRGYEEAEELVFENVNLELAKLLEDVHKFIIVDDSYGYNALSAAPYAVLTKSYVLFADSLNIDEVARFLDERGVESLIIFGRVDRDVRNALAKYNPEVINAGDRFDNNIAMVRKYLEVKKTKQAVLTNGEFIEASIMSGADPVIFIGRVNVPEKVKKFIQESDIDVGVLIGNELIGAATFIRRQVGISVFVKFAQGARRPTGPISKVEDLDRFPMPRYDLDLSIESVVYNRATGLLEVTYSNNVDLAAFFKSTITVKLPNGEQFTLGDKEPVFIDGDDLKTITYPATIEQGDVNVSVFTIYGEAPGSLENTAQGEFALEFVEVNDRSAVNITGLEYDSKAQKFYVYLKNVGPVRAYADVEIVALMVNEESTIVGGEEVVELKPGEEGRVPVSVELSPEDIADNEIVKVKARFGERKLALIKEASAEFAFKEVKKANYSYYLLAAVIILLIIVALKKRKRSEGNAPSQRLSNSR